MDDFWKSFLRQLEQIPRATFAFICWSLLLVGSHLVTGVFLELDSMWWGWMLWAAVMARSIRPFMVSVPEYTILVTINLLHDGLDALYQYYTGLHFRYPWEQVKDGNYINTRLIPINGEEDYPSRDGPKMHAKWQVQYRIVDAVKYMGVGHHAIEEVIRATMSSVLSAYIATHDAQAAKLNQKKAEDEMEEKIGALDPKKNYGVEMPVVSLADLDYEKSVQKVLATQFTAKKLQEIANQLQSTDPDEKIKAKDALNAAMIIHGDVTKHVNEVEGEGGNALAALLMAMAQGGGGRKEKT